MRDKKSKIILNFTLSFCILVFAFCISSNYTNAASASLYLSPSSGTYTVGSTFSVAVKVNSGGESINAAEANLIFNPNELQVVSLSKTGSIFSLWTTEPTFSNSVGNIVFGGGNPTPFSGSAGTILNITFKAKISGSSQVKFSSGSVLAADGKGTNVLASMTGGTYTLTPSVSAPPVEETPLPESLAPPAIRTPAAPVVSSPTHPDPEKWYSNNDPEFNWPLPSDVNGVSIYLSKSPTSNPGPLPDGLFTSKSYQDVEDGIWYFHIKFRNSFGWGAISHRKVLIDTTPPKPFKVEVKEGKETTNPSPTLVFGTTDEMSGIDHYQIIIDGKEPIKTDKTEYKIPPQDLGKHTIIVKAVDKAGNETLAMTEIEILPIEAPVITDYPKELLPGSILLIKGRAIPEAKIIIYVQKDKEEAKIGETKSDKEGKWVFIEVEPVEKGVYQVWAQAIDPSGAKSNFSEKVKILVSPPVFIRIGKLAIDYLTTIVTLLILILAIIFGIFWTWLEIKKRKKKIQKETLEAEKALHEAFKILKEKIKEEVAKLDGKAGLSEKEKKICNELKKALKICEEFIQKEIKDIDKEIKK